MKFIAHKTDDGRNKGKISFYCEALGVSRQGFYKYLENRDKPWKYEALSEKMTEIVSRMLATIHTERSGCVTLCSLKKSRRARKWKS